MNLPEFCVGVSTKYLVPLEKKEKEIERSNPADVVISAERNGKPESKKRERDPVCSFYIFYLCNHRMKMNLIASL